MLLDAMWEDGGMVESQTTWGIPRGAMFAFVAAAVLVSAILSMPWLRRSEPLIAISQRPATRIRPNDISIAIGSDPPRQRCSCPDYISEREFFEGAIREGDLLCSAGIKPFPILKRAP